MKELKKLITSYGERYSTAVIYILFVGASVLVSIILFGLLHSTGIMRVVFVGAVEQAEFGGAFAGFLITLMYLVRAYNQATAITKLVLTGNVVDSNNNPIKGALVYVEGVDRQKETDNTGWFAIEVNEQDSWVVRASYQSETTDSIVNRGDIRKPIRLKLEQSAKLDIAEEVSQNLLLHISVNNEPTGGASKHSRRTLNVKPISYQATQIGDTLRIEPQLTYLAKLADGGPISDDDFPGRVPFFPNLDLKIVNNTPQTVFFTDAIFDIERSNLDPWPILRIRDSYNLGLYLSNEGWGDVHGCLVRFNIVPPNVPVSFDQSYEHEVIVGNFSDHHTIDLSTILSQMGVNIEIAQDHFAHGYRPKESGAWMKLSFEADMVIIENSEGETIRVPKVEFEERRVKALGPFVEKYEFLGGISYRGKAIAYGDISFSGLTAQGDYKNSKIKFSTDISLDGPPIGAMAPPTYQYKTLLDIERSNYQVQVPISQAVKASDYDRFNIRIGSLKSSVHTFRLRLLYNAGLRLESPPIEMHIFVPKSRASQINNEKESGIVEILSGIKEIKRKRPTKRAPD